MTGLALRLREDSLPRSPHTRRGGSAHRARGVLVGLLVAALGYSIVASGWVAPPVTLLLGAASVLLPPTAKRLARRAALNGACVVGWFPLLWWVTWPVRLNHGALLVAVGLGVAAGCLAAGGRARSAVRPEVAAVDILVPLSGIAALAAMSRWAFPSSPAAALAAMLPGADNYPHFHMAATMREYGAALDTLGSTPDHSPWAFFNYPQGFHALVASAMETAAPHVLRGPALLVAYTRGEALVVVAGTMMLTAAIVSLAQLRDRPGISVVAVTATLTAYLWKPGQDALNDGFGNFWVGVLAVSCAHLLALSTPKALARAEVVAVGGLLVAAANAWAPLSVFGLPAALCLLVGLRPAGVDRGTMITCLVTGALAVVAALQIALLLFRTVPVEYVVTTQTGGLHGAPPLPTLGLVAVGAVVCVMSRRWWVDRADADPVLARRIRVLGLTVVGGFLALVAFFTVQMVLIGTLAYYFLKLHLGFQLILAGFLPALCGEVVATLADRRAGRRRTLLVVAATVVGTQVFGTFPSGPGVLHPGVRQETGTSALDPTYSRIGIARGVLRAVRATRGQDTFDLDYFPMGKARASNPFFGDGWFHGLSHSLSMHVFNRYAVWRYPSTGLDSASELIRTMLLDDPKTRVLVEDRFVAPLRERLVDPQLARRVVGMSAFRSGRSVESQ